MAALLAGCGSPEQRAQQYYESGMALIAKNDDLNARVALLTSAKYKSDRVEVWRALAGIDERTSSSSLFVDLRRIVELDPSDLDARLKLARIMISGGAADAALRILEAAKEETPSAALHAVKALGLLRSNDNEGAIREAQRAFEIDPKNLDAVSLLASKKIADGDPEAALKLLATLTVGPKDETRVLLLKMQAYARKGDLAQAEGLLRKVISLNPKEAAYHNQLVRILISQRRFDEAEKELRGKADANPSDTKSGLELVRFLNTVRGNDAARKELESRIKAGGDTFDYQIALVELDVLKGNLKEATGKLQALAESAPSAEKKAVAQIKLAELYVGRGNAAAAEPIVAEVLSKDRRNAGALRLRAAINIDRGRFDNAISDLREALNDQPKSSDLLVLLATAYERAGKPELAERQYADALKSSNQSPDMTLRYVAFLQRRGDAQRAEDVLLQVIARYPGNLQLLSSLGQVRLSRQNWDGALAVAGNIEKLDGGRSLADQIRAAAYSGQNKIDESIAALEDAHKSSPDAVQPIVALASAYVKSGKSDKAVAMLQDVTKKFPGNAEMWVLLGQIWMSLKKDDEVVGAFKSAIEHQPKSPAGYTALNEFYVQRKDFAAAGNVLEAGLKEIPNDLGLRLSQASLQILKGDNEAAIAQYEAVLRDQPNVPVAANNLASLLLDYRSDKESLDRALSLVETLRNTNVPQFLDTVGWAHYRKGQFKDAIATLESAAQKQPNSAVIHYHLGMSYAGAGMQDKAAEQLKLAATLEPDGTPLKESIQAAMK